MSTSASDARIALLYLAASIACAALGALYELFSHGVYSPCMVYAFAFPLCFGAQPYLRAAARAKRPIPGDVCRAMGHAGVATLTVGSMVCGALEIYGTSNRLTAIYWAAGGLLLLGHAALRVTARAATQSRTRRA